jgi:DNA-binding NarL/FixJ family response regulator
MKHRPRLLIADSHAFVAEACRQMLEPEFDVIGIVTDGRSLVEAALNLRPDGAILEVTLPQLRGLDAAEQIRSKLPSLKLIFLTSIAEADAAAEAFRRGAAAYMLKHSGTDEFRTALRRVMRGESYLSPLIARETLHLILHPPMHATLGKQLTQREAEVLQLLSEGNTMKHVAEILAITPSTVAFHKYRMMEKLGINTSAGLIQYAMKKYMTPSYGTWAFTDWSESRSMEVVEGLRSAQTA